MTWRKLFMYIEFCDWDLMEGDHCIEARLMTVLTITNQGVIQSAVAFSMN